MTGGRCDSSPLQEDINGRVLIQRAASHLLVACLGVPATVHDLLRQYRTCAVSGAARDYQRVRLCACVSTHGLHSAALDRLSPANLNWCL